MATLEVTTDNFTETIESDGIVLIDWWASWCGPCMQFAPIYEEAAADYPDVTFAKINTEEQRRLSELARIRSIPTVMAFRGGIMVFKQAGILPRNAIDDLIEEVRGLDMDDVRAQSKDY